jgi:hypothetical protein
MSNRITLDQFFGQVDHAISEMSEGNAEKEELLKIFFVRVLSILDGLEGEDSSWKGIRLVAPEDLPSGVREVNDGFLHDEWSERDGC